MKVQRKKVLDIYGVLFQYLNQKTTARGALNISRDKSLAEVEFKVIQEARDMIKPSDKFMEYEEKRIAVCEEVALKDEEGKSLKILLEDGREVFNIPPNKTKELEEKLNALLDGDPEYKPAIEEKNKTEEEFKNLLEEEVEMSFVKINIDDLPNEITPNEIQILEPLLEVGD